MTYGIEKERRLQIGAEVTPGTAVAASVVFRGPQAGLEDASEKVIPTEHVGYAVQLDRSYFKDAAAVYNQPETEATFEQLPLILAGGVKSVVSGAANGGTTVGYKYLYPCPTVNADHTFKTFTLEAGDNNKAYEMEYGFVEQFRLTGAPRESVKVSDVVWRGRQRSAASFTGALTLPTVEEILFSKGKLYLDAVGGTIGSTQKTNTWLGFDLLVETGLIPVFTGDGNLYFSFVKATGMRISGSLTVEHDGVATALEDDWAAKTTRLLRMDFPGTALSGSGGTYASKLLRIDMAALLTRVNPIDAVNGNDVLKVEFQAVYNATAGKFAEFDVCNLLSTVV